MNNIDDELDRKSLGIPEHPDSAAMTVSVLTGAATGGAIGLFTFAGPLSLALGVIIGAVAGAGIGTYVRQRSKRERARDEILDREIGVIDGDIGMPRRARGR
jgi:hypothetical protein